MAVTHFELEIEKIKEEILKMGGLVEDAVDDAIRSLTARDKAGAREVIRNDARIDQLENDIDAHSVRMIARHQPVATDLRFLTAALRLCAILERMGDQAVNVAERSLILADMTPMNAIPPTVLEMAELAKDMTRRCLDAFVRRDVQLAYDVCCQDDEMDDMNRGALEEMIGWMMEEKRLIRRGVEIILIARNFERIGDLATNVSEEVVFIVEGTVIRHHGGLEICSTGRDRETTDESEK